MARLNNLHIGDGGAMGNSSNELREKIKLFGEKGYIGGSVNENGLLDIFKYFELIL